MPSNDLARQGSRHGAFSRCALEPIAGVQGKLVPAESLKIPFATGTERLLRLKGPAAES